jgi:hypothetical protein
VSSNGQAEVNARSKRRSPLIQVSVAGRPGRYHVVSTSLIGASRCRAPLCTGRPDALQGRHREATKFPRWRSTIDHADPGRAGPSSRMRVPGRRCLARTGRRSSAAACELIVAVVTFAALQSTKTLEIFRRGSSSAGLAVEHEEES